MAAPMVKPPATTIGRRAAQIGGQAHCMVFACGRAVTAQAGKGMSGTYCRYHLQHRARHGDFVKKTYTAATLHPYRWAAERFIRDHAEDQWIAHALTALQVALDTAGRAERVADIVAMRTPRKKARAALARMREAGVEPRKLLSIVLAVSAALKEDPIQPSGRGDVERHRRLGLPDYADEYKLTQIGKLAFRTHGGGYHSVYGPLHRFDRYAPSSGVALRLLGLELDRACEHVVAQHLSAVLALKHRKFGKPRLGVLKGKVIELPADATQ